MLYLPLNNINCIDEWENVSLKHDFKLLSVYEQVDVMLFNLLTIIVTSNSQEHG